MAHTGAHADAAAHAKPFTLKPLFSMILWNMRVRTVRMTWILFRNFCWAQYGWSEARSWRLWVQLIQDPFLVTFNRDSELVVPILVPATTGLC